MRRDAGQKNGPAGRQDHQVRWDAASTADLDHPGRLVADASAGRDAGHSDVHQKAKDHDYRSAWVHDYQWEAGHDCQLAKGVAADRRAEQAHPPQGEQLPAGPAFVGRGEADAEPVNCREYSVRPDATAGHEAQVALAVDGKAHGYAAQREQQAWQLREARAFE